MTLDPGVVVGLSVSAAQALLGPPLAVWLFRRRTGAPWAALGLGALTFFVSQVVLRLPWQVGIGVWLKDDFAQSPPLLMGWVVLSCSRASPPACR